MKLSDAEARDRAISDGVLIALAALHAMGDAQGGTHYGEVLALAGRDKVIAQARRTGSMRWSGLTTWLRSQGHTERDGQ